MEAISILRDNKSFNKFCLKENKCFGCQELWGCKISCPLWRAREVENLVNYKGMTIGEAHKASLREHLTKDEIHAALRAIFERKKTISLAELLDILEK